MLLRKMQRGKHIKSEAATFKLSIPKSHANDVKALKVYAVKAHFLCIMHQRMLSIHEPCVMHLKICARVYYFFTEILMSHIFKVT